MHPVIEETFTALQVARESSTLPLQPREIGHVLSITPGIVTCSGLPNVGFSELVRFPGDLFGIAYNIDENEIGVVLLGDDSQLQVGDEVSRTGTAMDVMVGDALIGRIVNPLGEPLDDKGLLPETRRLPLERPAPSIMDRDFVTVPLQTGIKVIDALIPIGRGQRELILGDRQTGKTSIAIDTIINQKGKDVICIYCSIGQRTSSVAKAIANLRAKGAMDYTIVVLTEGNTPPGLQFIAPYAATTMAEYFMEQGKDVLIIYDDLTHHARAYRELSLLLRRPPGREAFPGDIFYIHSRLLERATHLSPQRGGGSLTALPIVETEGQNISAYIPTNLISITDGQLFLSPRLFELGILPAIDIGKSVSRVGGKAQLPAYRAVAGHLKLSYAQFEELESFARFGTRLDEHTRKVIEHGKRIREILKQPELQPRSVQEQIFILLALTHGLFADLALEDIPAVEELLLNSVPDIPAQLIQRLSSGQNLQGSDVSTLVDTARVLISKFKTSSRLPGSPENL